MVLYRKDRIKFLEVSRQYEAAVKNFLTAQEERIISSRKISILYSYITSKLNHSGGISPLQKEDGSFVLSDKDKCDLLIQYFTSVFTKDDQAFLREYLISPLILLISPITQY